MEKIHRPTRAWSGRNPSPIRAASARRSMRDPLPASASIEPEASTTASMADGTLSWLHEKTASAIALAAGGRREAPPSSPGARSPSSEISERPTSPSRCSASARARARDPGAASAATMRGKSRTGAPTAGVRSRRSARPSTVSSCCSVATTSRGERRANMAGWTVASSPATVRALWACAKGTRSWRAASRVRPTARASASGAVTARAPATDDSGLGTDTRPDASASPHVAKRCAALPPTRTTGVRARLFTSSLGRVA